VNNEIKEDEKGKNCWKPERGNKVVVGRRKILKG